MHLNVIALKILKDPEFIEKEKSMILKSLAEAEESFKSKEAHSSLTYLWVMVNVLIGDYDSIKKKIEETERKNSMRRSDWQHLIKKCAEEFNSLSKSTLNFEGLVDERFPELQASLMNANLNIKTFYFPKKNMNTLKDFYIKIFQKIIQGSQWGESAQFNEIIHIIDASNFENVIITRDCVDFIMKENRNYFSSALDVGLYLTGMIPIELFSVDRPETLFYILQLPDFSRWHRFKDKTLEAMSAADLDKYISIVLEDSISYTERSVRPTANHLSGPVKGSLSWALRNNKVPKEQLKEIVRKWFYVFNKFLSDLNLYRMIESTLTLKELKEILSAERDLVE